MLLILGYLGTLLMSAVFLRDGRSSSVLGGTGTRTRASMSIRSVQKNAFDRSIIGWWLGLDWHQSCELVWDFDWINVLKVLIAVQERVVV